MCAARNKNMDVFLRVETPFLLLTFLWAQQRKVRGQPQKKIQKQPVSYLLFLTFDKIFLILSAGDSGADFLAAAAFSLLAFKML